MTTPGKTTRTPKKTARRLGWQETFLRVFSETLNVSAAVESAGISRSTAYLEHRRNPEFAAQWDDARKTAIEKLEAAAFERAKNVSDTLLIFLLKSHKPDRYRDRIEATTATINLDLEKLTDEQLERIAAGESPTAVIRPSR